MFHWLCTFLSNGTVYGAEHVLLVIAIVLLFDRLILGASAWR